MLILKAVGTLAEWSKALDLSPNIERCVGSNPTGTIFNFGVSIFKESIIEIMKKSIHFVGLYDFFRKRI